MKTKEKIIQAALLLFNERGETNISTNHISDYLAISPGNLYYYFNNKEEIIRDIFDLYAHDIGHYFQPTHEVNLETLVEYFDALFLLMWKYRFFYLNMANIVIRDSELQNKHLLVSAQVTNDLINLIKSMRTADLIHITDNLIDPFVNTTKIVTSAWLSFYISENPNAEITPKSINLAVTQTAYLFLPIATEKGSELLNVIVDYYHNEHNNTAVSDS